MTVLEEQQYWQERDFVPDLLSQLPLQVFWKNRECVYLGCNEAFAKSLGLNSPSDIIGKTDYDLPIKKENSDAYRLDDKQVMESRQPKLNIEEPQVFADGRKGILLTSKVPLLHKNGELMGVLGIYSDITAQKLAEEREKAAISQAVEEKTRAQAAAEKSESLAVMAGAIGHDLRNPLSTLLILATTLPLVCPNMREKNDWEGMAQQIDETVAAMKRTAENANKDISDTLNLTRKLLTDTLTEADYKICEIEPCIMEVLRSPRFTPEIKKMIHCKDINNFEFKGINALFYRVLTNLLNNAIRQIEKKGQGEIEITTAEDDKYNILLVKDTAGGLKPSDIENIFRSYENSTTQGTGIGLAFCKITMKSFGGDIACRIVDGEFIQFILSFPKIS